MTNKFETGKTYAARSICNHDCVWEFKVLKRTAKRITLLDTQDGIERVKGITVDHTGGERVYPLGRYSMAPSITPDKIVA